MSFSPAVKTAPPQACRPLQAGVGVSMHTPAASLPTPETLADEAFAAQALNAAKTHHNASFSARLVIVGVTSYLCCMWIICSSGIGDKELEAEYAAKVPQMVYQWPMVAFATAFMLNFMQLLFERESTKYQLALIACYINALAGFSDFLSWKGYTPICRDVFGQGLHVGRMTMWLHTTVPMVYLLSIISDFTRSRIYVCMTVDASMIAFALAGGLALSASTAAPLYAGVTACFCYTMWSMWHMFEASLAEARDDGSRLSLQVLRICTLSLWCSFPITFLAIKLGLVDVVVEEWLWSVGDFMGKVMYSSSLLQGNFLTIGQRRLIAMRIVEEGNRLKVIQELTEVIEQKERFMSGMSHELRTPLNGIIGLSEAMVSGSCGALNEMTLKTICTIKTSGNRLLNLINDILDAASMRQAMGHLTIKEEKVRLDQVVGDVLDLCQPLAKRGVKLLSSIPADLAVMGDTGRIIQILHNLLGNSCKFTHKGHILIAAHTKLDEVELSVTDTGIGIPVDKFESVFAAFEQVDMSTTRKYGGTGLGLNLVKQLVEAHGGTIHVKSKLGVGTTFFFSLQIWDDSDVDTDGGHSNSRDGMGLMSGLAPNSGSSSVRRQRSTLLARETIQRSRSGLSMAPSQGQTTSAVHRRSSFFSGRQSDPVKALSHLRPGASTSSQKLTCETVSPAAPGSAAPTHEAFRTCNAGQNVTGPVSLGEAAMLLPIPQHLEKQGQSAAWRMRLQSSKDSPSPKIHVLSVDDDPVNQMVVMNLLPTAIYTVTQAMDGTEALEVLEGMEEMPDCILLDVMMPGMSGYEVCRVIRERFPLSCMPIIMISAKSKEENIVQGLDCGSNDYVVKPFGRQEILARITAHLRFRNDVYQAGEMAGSSDKFNSHVPVCLAPYMHIDGQGTTLPSSLAMHGLPGGATNMQVFPLVTMLVMRVGNLADVLDLVCVDAVAAALCALFAAIDQALALHGGYCIDDVAQAHMTVLTGLNNEADQATRALLIAQAALAEASKLVLPGGKMLEVVMAMHSLPCKGIVHGTSYPVMHVLGQLPVDTGYLLGVAAPGSVLVSAHSHQLLQGKASLMRGGLWRGEPTYLFTNEGCHQQALLHVTQQLQERQATVPPHTASHVARLKSIQRAFMEIVRVSPVCMFELGNASLAFDLGKAGSVPGKDPPASPGRSRRGSRSSLEGRGVEGWGPRQEVQPAPAATQGQPATSTDLQAQVLKLLAKQALLERQLGETTSEAARLADENDELCEETRELRAQLAQLAAKHLVPLTLATANAGTTLAQSELFKVKAALEGSGAALQASEAEMLTVRSQMAGLRAQLLVVEQQLLSSDAELLAAQAGQSAAEAGQAAAEAGQVAAEAGQSAAVARAATLQEVLLLFKGRDPISIPPPTSAPSAVVTPRPSLYGSQGVAPHSGDARSGIGSGRAGPVSRNVLTVNPQGGLAYSGPALNFPPYPPSVPSQQLITRGSYTGSAVNSSAFCLSPEAAVDIATLLDELGLTLLLPRFLEEAVTPSMLQFLDEQMMRELGAHSLGARTKLKMAAHILKGE